MAEANWIRHSVYIGLVEVQRSLRSFRQNQSRFRLLVFALINLVLFFGGMGALFALALRSQPRPIPVPSQLRLVVSFLWLFGVWLFAKRVILYRRRLDSEAFVLTTVSPRTAAVGLLFTELLTACVALAVPTPFLIGVIGYAFLDPVSLLLIPLAVVLFAATAIVIGYILGFGYLFLAAHSRYVVQHQSNLGIQLVLVVVAGYVTVQVLFSVPPVTEVVAVKWVPLGWLVDLAVLSTPVTVSLGRAVASVIGSLVVIVGGGATAVRLATTYWATDRGSTLQDRDTAPSHPHGHDSLAAALSPVIIPQVASPPTRRVAQVVLLRLRRAPRRLTFLFTITLSLGLSLGPVASQMEHPLALVSVACALFIPWLAGAAFGLNPLGDKGAVLPAILTASVSGREFIRGMMLPGLLYGLPLTVVTTLITSVFSPYTVAEQLGLVVLGAVLLVVAVALAPAIGMRFPRFSALTVGQSREVVPPSLTAIATYVFLTGGISGIAILFLLTPSVAQGLLILLGTGRDLLTPAVIRLGGFAGWLLILLGCSYWLYRDTADRFTTYTVE